MNAKSLASATVLSAILMTAAGCKDQDEKDNTVEIGNANTTEVVSDTIAGKVETLSFPTSSFELPLETSEHQNGAVTETPATQQSNGAEPVRTGGQGKFGGNPYATVTEEDMRYVDIPGNEFSMIFTSASFPQGRTVTIDPDDMMPVNDPRRDGLAVLAPRQRFFYEINNQLPAIPGREMARLGENEGLSPKGAVTMYKHLTDAPMLSNSGEVIGGGHGISKDQILEAMRRCHEPRGLSIPTAE